MKARLVFQHLNESHGKMFEPEYFKLPYQIPENRFEKGLLKSSTARRGSTSRKINVNTNTKYKDLQDYAKRVKLSEVNAQIKADVSKVMKFIRNNPLTGNLIKPELYSDESMGLKAYIKNIIDGEGINYDSAEVGGPLHLIMLSGFDMTISVDYDIYKGCTIFTFGYDSLFYYYTVFTLDKNDVMGAGEENTYITVNEFINYIFYETIWRNVLNNGYIDNTINMKKLGVNPNDLEKYYGGLNTPYAITDNYFNPKFKKVLTDFIKASGEQY